ncbi:MAG: RdgB/HAM1 family non-canonical purine NTP pyrophosphatase [Acidimicrobiia bacterium]
MTKILIASHNKDKIKEIQAIFVDTLNDIEFVDGIDPGEVEEDGDTIEENSMIKANAWLDVNPDCVVISDDTGLYIEALNGDPGVFAARYAGEGCSYQDNCDKVMENMQDIENRKAKFSTCATAVRADSPSIVAIGNVEGLIAKKQSGASGFGYDPVFIPSQDEDGPTYADMSIGAKNMISHRSKAFRALAIGIRDAKW